MAMTPDSSSTTASDTRRRVSVPAVLLSVLLAILVLWLLQRLLVPKYVDGIVEGAFVAEFYGAEHNHDLIFVGDCEVYENFSPVTLWQEYGINSYIRGSAEQYIFQSYYLLEDTLMYEHPKAVVFNIQSLQFDKSRSEAYNRMSIEGMRWSPYKVGAINASKTEEEHFLDYVFPILRYHSRWSELTAADFEYMFKAKKVTHNGYYMRVDVRPVTTLPPVKPLADYSFGENAWAYLDKIVQCCREKDIQLILIKAPSLYPHWYDQWDQQVKAYAAEHQLPYYNMLEATEEIGLDYSTDTYDGGLHMNLSGAEKCARWLGKLLTEKYSFESRRGEKHLEEVWTGIISDYNAEIEAQKIKYGIA